MQTDINAITGIWAAVIVQAVRDCAPKRGGKAEAQAAARWLDSDERGPCSFLWLCDVLDLDARAIRRISVKVYQGDSETLDRLKRTYILTSRKS